MGTVPTPWTMLTAFLCTRPYWLRGVSPPPLRKPLPPPRGVTAKMIDCKIEAAHITLGLKGNPAFMNEDFEQKVNASESYWTVEDGVIHLILTKGSKGVTWPCFVRGHAPVDPFTQQEVQKSLMLERFQEENPGFDFSGASLDEAQEPVAR